MRVRIHLGSAVPPEPYSNDFHNVCSIAVRTRRRPAKQDGAGNHLPHNLCADVLQRTGRFLGGRDYEEDEMNVLQMQEWVIQNEMGHPLCCS